MSFSATIRTWDVLYWRAKESRPENTNLDRKNYYKIEESEHRLKFRTKRSVIMFHLLESSQTAPATTGEQKGKKEKLLTKLSLRAEECMAMRMYHRICRYCNKSSSWYSANPQEWLIFNFANPVNSMIAYVRCWTWLQHPFSHKSFVRTNTDSRCSSLDSGTEACMHHARTLRPN